jgi:hypothetical protein
MGLDAYVMVKTGTKTKTGKDEANQLWYGRKENEIHGWMQRKSGVPADDFNCVDFPLTLELIHEFEVDVNNRLPETAGFFFGGNNEYDDVKAAAQDLITAVKVALADGQKPFYSSWW